jgi:hypothetical protein
MKPDNTNRESQRVAELAAEYERKGYTVTLPRRPQDGPAFLRELGYTPDLIAKTKDETLIIEVKSRQTSATLSSLSVIAERINAKPGWQFVLVFTNPRTAGSEPQSATPDKVLALLEKSRAMGFASQPHLEAAFLFAWVALEAALLASPKKATTGRSSSTPWTLIRDAAMNGLLAREDAHALERLFRIRNALLHAADEVPPTQADVENLRRIAQELLRQRERDEA